jgi:hypothetical protein
MTSINSIPSSAAATTVDAAKKGTGATAAAPAAPTASTFDLDDMVSISDAGRKKLREVAG